MVFLTSSYRSYHNSITSYILASDVYLPDVIVVVQPGVLPHYLVVLLPC